MWLLNMAAWRAVFSFPLHNNMATGNSSSANILQESVDRPK